MNIVWTLFATNRKKHSELTAFPQCNSTRKGADISQPQLHINTDQYCSIFCLVIIFWCQTLGNDYWITENVPQRYFYWWKFRNLSIKSLWYTTNYNCAGTHIQIKMFIYTCMLREKKIILISHIYPLTSKKITLLNKNYGKTCKVLKIYFWSV